MNTDHPGPNQAILGERIDDKKTCHEFHELHEFFGITDGV